MEAAEEIAKQLRLRDIGGLIVVDFIDMMQRKHTRAVEKAIKDAMKVDRARHHISRISENGLLEINRQRLKQALQLRSHRACPTCEGSGLLASTEHTGLNLLRRIEARARETGLPFDRDAWRAAALAEPAATLQTFFAGHPMLMSTI